MTKNNATLPNISTLTMNTDIEIDWSDDAFEAPAPTIAVLMPDTNGGWDRGVSEQAAVLVEKEREIANVNGFTHDDSELFYTAGTQLADVGLDAAATFAREYMALPTTTEAAVSHTAVIKDEQRIDRIITPSAWRINSNGLLQAIGDASIKATLSDTAWLQLGQRQTEIVSDAPRGNVNAWIGLVNSESKARVRTLNGGRQIYAVVSSSTRGYTAYDSDAVLRDLARAMPGTRCEVDYDAATTRLKARAYIQAPVDVPAFIGVGRVHRAGIQFMTRDDGMMALTGQAFIERIRCKNHTLVEERGSTLRRRHKGTYATLQAQIDKLVGQMPTMITTLKDLWARSATEYYLDSESGAQLSAPEAITRLVMHGHIPTGGLEPEAAIDAYVAAWRSEESPHSAAGVIMAIQRAAHETTWRSQWSTDEIETSASNMLYQHVYTLSPAELAAT